MPTSLNLFPARVAIGTVQADGTVLMTMEFSRAMSDLFTRVGGTDAPDINEIEMLAATSDSNVLALISDSKIDEMQAQVGQSAELQQIAKDLRNLQERIEQISNGEYLRGIVSSIKTELAMIEDPAAQIRFLGVSLAKKQNRITPSPVTGSRGGNAALASLLTNLASKGLIIDNTTP